MGNFYPPFAPIKSELRRDFAPLKAQGEDPPAGRAGIPTVRPRGALPAFQVSTGFGVYTYGVTDFYKQRNRHS